MITDMVGFQSTVLLSSICPICASFPLLLTSFQMNKVFLMIPFNLTWWLVAVMFLVVY